VDGIEIGTEIAAAAAVLGLISGLVQYGLDRRIAVDVKAKSDRRLRHDGVAVEVQNRSVKRDANILDVEILHRGSFLGRRSSVSAGPFMEPLTPWSLGPDDSTKGWVSLRAVDGSENGVKDAEWTFSKPIKVRLKLDGRRGPTSRRCRIERAA
jgi:hypothetical protein